MKKVVVALGGNALQSKDREPTAQAQLEVVQETSKRLAEICEGGYDISVVHGNGPQVGRIVLAYDAAKEVVPEMPFDVCGAMSQGYIGYHIQQALAKAIRDVKISHSDEKQVPVATVVTQMVVDEADPGFQNPTKPIGAYYTEEEARALEQTKGFAMREDSGRGWRRVVASPLPKRIVELPTILEVAKNGIVIACGGGGIPVVENPDGSLRGVAAVIDKDFAAELLAEDMDADILLILTTVEKVSIDFNKPTARGLDTLDIQTAEKYVAEGQFAPGSMLPKVQAALKFVQSNPRRKAIITSLDKAIEALNGKTGTHFSL